MSELKLLQDEIAMLSESARCEECGHLEALHNEHCCSHCTVGDCLCAWDKVPRCKADGCDNKCIRQRLHTVEETARWPGPYIVDDYCSRACAFAHRPTHFREARK